MFKITSTAAAVLLSLAALAGAAQAATFDGSFWNYKTNSIASAISHADSHAADATFQSSAIDYPNGSAGLISDATSLSSFLGADAATLTAMGGTNLDGSVFRFTGYLDLGAGSHSFKVSSDDGFRLTLPELTYVSGTTSANDRSFSSSTSTFSAAVAGIYAFELYFYENGGFTGVEFYVDGALATPASLPAVPVPAAGLLLLGALGSFAVARRRKA